MKTSSISIKVCFVLLKGHSGGVQEDDMAPSAPPLDHMDHVNGYEATSFDAREFSIDWWPFVEK